MNEYLEKLEQAENQAPGRIAVAGPETLEALRLEYLGRKGIVTATLQSLGKLPAEDRPALGKRANETKNLIAGLIENRQAELEEERLAREIAGTRIDVTLPGTSPWRGGLHPITRALDRLVEIFFSLGFTIADGPEVDDEFHNFDALNTPEHHPARDAQDTLYLKNGLLLRSQTSTVQVRYMMSHRPPVRIIAPGRVFRRDTPDASHSPIFHQLEGLYVDENVTFGDLKYTLAQFAKQMFGQDTTVRFRPSFFPFTEPSAEVDCRCVFCAGKGCPVCKQSGWMEILGCGMVDPAVFEAVGYDPERWTGFAFGMGIDRICMALSNVNDIRMFLESDLGFLSQF